jgi:hypothetical protein
LRKSCATQKWQENINAATYMKMWRQWHHQWHRWRSLGMVHQDWLLGCLRQSPQHQHLVQNLVQGLAGMLAARSAILAMAVAVAAAAVSYCMTI